MNRLAVSLIAMFALLAGAARSQGQGRGFFGSGPDDGGLGGSGGFVETALRQLVQPGVRKQLDLNDNQYQSVNELSQMYTSKLRETRELSKGLDPADRMAKMRGFHKEFNEPALTKIRETLNREQMDRLRSITYQRMGPLAFREQEVRERLNLTQPQREKIDGILHDYDRDRGEIRALISDDRKAALEKFAELNKRTVDKILAELTEEQVKTWKDFIGPPAPSS